MTATAAWPLPMLVEALRRTTALERRQVDVLSALSSVLPHGAATGRTTAPQLSDLARYSEKWTRHALAELEALGLIVWRRGGVVAGQPQPSHLTVVKTALAALIRGGREALADRRAMRAALTRRRIDGRTLPPRGGRRTSAHAELSGSPLLRREVTAGQPAPRRSLGVVDICEHGGQAGLLTNGTPRCPMCRSRLSVS